MTCERFDRAWASDDAREREALREHARGCASCSQRLAWERRLDRAARALRPSPPAGLREAILADLARERGARHAARWSLRWVRRTTGAAIAAALLLAIGIHLLRAPAGDREGSRLLSPSGLVAALGEEQRLDAAIAARGEHGPAVSSPLDPALEEIAFLDAAIEECRRALRNNARHAELRRTLHDLSRRKLELLRGAARREGGRQG